MEMDPATALISVAMLLLFTVPFIVMHFGKVKHEKKQVAVLSKLASTHAMNIDRFDVCGSIAIALDTPTRTAFFVKYKNQNHSTQMVHLTDIQHVRVEKKTRSVLHNKSTITTFERIEMHLIPKIQTNRLIVFTFFDESDSLPLSGELQLAEKWTAILNGLT